MSRLVAMTFVLTIMLTAPMAMAVEIKPFERFSLGEQIPAAAGYDIRARQFTVPSGGNIPEHAHTTRPGIVYVLSGEIVEYRGQQKRVLKAGDTLVEDAGTVHRYENVSDEPCVLIGFDIPLSEPEAN